jgi:hypothetical protein
MWLRTLWQARMPLQVGMVAATVCQNNGRSFGNLEAAVKKRSSKQILEEVQSLYLEMVSSLIYPEVITPDERKTLLRVWNSVSSPRLKAVLSKLPDEKAEEVRTLLESLPHKSRRILSANIRRIPHDPGGRPKALPDEDCRKVVASILARIAEGAELREAKELVARKFKVSLSTVQRAWRDRAKLPGNQQIEL